MMYSNKTTSRRDFLRTAALLGAAATIMPDALNAATSKQKKRSLFDGKTLNGWHAMPRIYIPQQFADVDPDEVFDKVVAWAKENGQQDHLTQTGRWEVVDGAITGGHDPEDSIIGSYLVSDEKFGDFELEVDARPDWPADTGIMLRANKMASLGFQTLVDHRPHGNIGGIYGNSLGNFLAGAFFMNGDSMPGFKVQNLRVDEAMGSPVVIKPEYAAPFDIFKKAWRPNEWNHFKIRCVGRLPVFTTWINGTKMCELNTANIQNVKGYDPEKAAKRLGREGHIAFEVHDVPPTAPLGRDRWAIGAKCRWKNIYITPL